jgi:hypothetical protein
MRQRAERTHLALYGQCLYAANRRGPRVRRSLPNIRGADGRRIKQFQMKRLIIRQLCPVRRVT